MKDLVLVLITLSIFLLGYVVVKKLDDYAGGRRRPNKAGCEKGKHPNRPRSAKRGCCDYLNR